MKTTIPKLRRIVRKVIVESAGDYIDPEQDDYNNLYDNLDTWAKTNMDRETLVYKLRQQARRRFGLNLDYMRDPAIIEDVVDDWITANKGEL